MRGDVVTGNGLVDEQRLDLGQRPRIFREERAADRRGEPIEVAAVVALEELSIVTLRGLLEEAEALLPEARGGAGLGWDGAVVEVLIADRRGGRRRNDSTDRRRRDRVGGLGADLRP